MKVEIGTEINYNIPKEGEFRLIEYLIKRKYGGLSQYLQSIDFEIKQRKNKG